MYRRGSVRYYTFLLLFIVAFVAAVGALSHGSFAGNSITGNVVLDPGTIPQVRDTSAIQAELTEQVSAVQKPTVPLATRRVFITANPGVAEEALHGLVAPRHFFRNGFSADATEAQLAQLEGLAAVEPVPLYTIAAPKNRPQAQRVTPTAQVPWGITLLYEGRATLPSGGLGITVAVLDTGIGKHPDLNRRIAKCKDFTRGPQIRNSCTDQNGHGTHVAGTIAADGGSDGKGIYGVAPEAKLAIYRVCDSQGQCFADDIAAALEHALNDGIQIISLSLGSRYPSTLIHDAITHATSAGILVVAAAGNSGPSVGSMEYPGAYAEVVGVGAVDSGLTVAPFSSRGTNNGDGLITDGELHFTAPGVSVESTWPDGGYRLLSGTSMATPHLSGLAAKLWQGSPQSTLTTLIQLAAAHDIAAAGDDPAGGLGLPTVGTS